MENPKEILNAIGGYVREDFEKIFEKVILPIYFKSSAHPIKAPKYKITNTENGEEYTEDRGLKEYDKLRPFF